MLIISQLYSDSPLLSSVIIIVCHSIFFFIFIVVIFLLSFFHRQLSNKSIVYLHFCKLEKDFFVICLGIGDSVTCSHSRSRDLFTESINSNCKFYGHLCPSGDSFEAGSCLGCPSGGCPVMGYEADLTSASKGTYYLSTSGSAPYCGMGLV